jgi:hypothetical protein
MELRYQPVIEKCDCRCIGMVVISRGSSEDEFAPADEPAPIVYIVFAGYLVDLNDLVVVIDRDVWIDSVIVLHSVRTGIPYNARTATSRVLEVPDSIIEARATAARFMHLHDDTIAIDGGGAVKS